MVRRRAQRAVSNHGSKFGLAAILRDALASLGLLRMRSEGWKDSQPIRVTDIDHSLPSSQLLQRLDANHDAVVVDVPERQRVSGIGDHGCLVVEGRLRQTNCGSTYSVQRLSLGLKRAIRPAYISPAQISPFLSGRHS